MKRNKAAISEAVRRMVPQPKMKNALEQLVALGLMDGTPADRTWLRRNVPLNAGGTDGNVRSDTDLKQWILHRFSKRVVTIRDMKAEIGPECARGEQTQAFLLIDAMVSDGQLQTPRLLRAALNTQLEQEILEYVETVQPVNARRVAYQMDARPHLQLRAGKKDFNRIIKLVGQMRIEGRMPWDWIVDDTREHQQKAAESPAESVESVMQTAAEEENPIIRTEDPEAYMRAFISRILQHIPQRIREQKPTVSYLEPDLRGSRWFHQPRHVEVFVEKRGLLQEVHAVTNEWEIGGTALGGQPSLTLSKQIADHFDSVSHRHGQTCVAVLMVDHDPSGFGIMNTLKKHISQFCKHAKVEYVHLALTTAQVREHQLPLEPINPKDPNLKYWPGGDAGTNLDALDIRFMRELLNDRIADLYDENAAQAHEQDWLNALKELSEKEKAFEAEHSDFSDCVERHARTVERRLERLRDET